MKPITKNQPIESLHRLHRVYQILLTTGLIVLPTLAHAQTAQDIQTDELRRAQERAQQVQDQQPAAPDVRMDAQTDKNKPAQIILPIAESPSFTIRHIIKRAKDCYPLCSKI